MQVGTTKDQGLYNKPLAAVHPGALAAGSLSQYNTIQYKIKQEFKVEFYVLLMFPVKFQVSWFVTSRRPVDI